MASASSAIPGGLAAPDDQGNLPLCSRYALGKAAANGFMEGKFNHQKLDFDQRDIVTLIVNSDKVRPDKVKPSAWFKTMGPLDLVLPFLNVPVPKLLGLH